MRHSDGKSLKAFTVSTIAMTVVGTYARQKPYPRRKVKMLNELVELLKNNRYILVFDLHGVPARILHEYRYRLRRIGATIKIAKNTLFLLALHKALGEVPEEVTNVLRGEIGLIFTNRNPFEIYRYIELNKVRREAKPGDIADFDIVVPAGPTKLGPGPILSRFGKLRIPTRVQDGKIWIVKDSTVVKAGQQVTPEAAEILRAIGVQPMFEGLKILWLIVDGKRVVPGSELALDPAKHRSLVEEASRNAVNLALNAVLPIPETLVLAVSAAHTRAVNLAANADIVIPETASLVILKAVSRAKALASMVAARAPELGLETPVPQPVQEPQFQEEAKQAEEKSEGEEDVGAGLSSLFG